MATTPLRLHPLADLPSLSRAARRGLARLGVHYAEDLIAHSSGSLKSLAAAAAGVGLPTLVKLLPAARFLRLAGVDGAAAERLAAAGFRDYPDLVFGDERLVARALVGGTADHDTPAEQAARLQKAAPVQLDAARRNETTSIRVIVTAARTKRPLKGAVVFLGGVNALGHPYRLRRLTGPRGSVVFDYVRPGLSPYTFAVAASGYQRLHIGVPQRRGSAVQVRVTLDRGRSVPDVDEFKGERMGLLTGFEARRLRRVPRPGSLPMATPLRVSNKTVAAAAGRRARVLVSVWRRQYGLIIETPTVAVPESALPRGWKPGMMVRRSGAARYAALRPAQARSILVQRNGFDPRRGRSNG